MNQRFTTASSMHSFKKTPEEPMLDPCFHVTPGNIKPSQRRLAAAVTAACLAVAGLLPASALAVEATLLAVEITRDEPGERPGLFVADHYEFDLPQPLIDALHRGIALYFTHEFSLVKTRWYWFDKPVAESRFSIRLAFNPLTRRYGVAYSGLSLNFDSLEQALPYIKSLRRWRVAPSGAVTNPEDFEAEIRFYLDTEKLPKPMQVTTNDSVDWTVESEWTTIRIPADIADIPAE